MQCKKRCFKHISVTHVMASSYDSGCMAMSRTLTQKAFESHCNSLPIVTHYTLSHGGSNPSFEPGIFLPSFLSAFFHLYFLGWKWYHLIKMCTDMQRQAGKPHSRVYKCWYTTRVSVDAVTYMASMNCPLLLMLTEKSHPRQSRACLSQSVL